MFVHNFIFIFLIFVLFFVLTYLVLILYNFNKKYRYLDINKHVDNVIVCMIVDGRYWFEQLPILIPVIELKKNYTLINKELKLSHNMNLEIIWTILPIAIILEMIFPSLSLVADEEVDYKGSLYTVGVIGNQWYWNYELNLSMGVIKYVSNLILLEGDNEEHLNYNRLLTTTKSVPIAVGVKTSFYITSNDVAHSWAVPGLGVKVDAIPGRINLKTIIASRLGLYNGMCSELCGVEHGFMPISLQVLTCSKWWYNIKGYLEKVNAKNLFSINDIWYIKKN